MQIIPWVPTVIKLSCWSPMESLTSKSAEIIVPCIIISGNGYAHAVVVILFYFFKNYFHHYLRLGIFFFREIKFQEKKSLSFDNPDY